MTKTTYLVELTPLDHYFFGGEQTFGGGESRNYLVHSRKWPQQTTLLGMIRYLLLQENNLLAQAGKKILPNEEGLKAQDLIGPTSFHLDGEPPTFGKIDSLSPLFLRYQEKEQGQVITKTFIRAAINHGKPLKERAEAEVWYGGPLGFQPALEVTDYSAKKGLDEQLIALQDGTLIAGDEPFQAVSQIGIEKARDGKTRDQAFYKQTFYRLKAGWSFACYLTIDQEVEGEFPLQTEVPFGGEKSLFQWKASESSEAPAWENWSGPEDDQDRPRILLLSDALVEPSIYEHCAFAITGTRDFRFQRAIVEKTTNYSALNGNDKDPNTRWKSDKFNLLKAGSVLYPSDLPQVKQALNQRRLQDIGLNHFLLLS